MSESAPTPSTWNYISDAELAERDRATAERAWDDGHRDVCNDCCCRPDANPYRAARIAGDRDGIGYEGDGE